MDSLDSSLILDGIPPSLPSVLPPRRPLVQLALRIGSIQIGLILDPHCLALVAYRGKRRVLQLSAGDLG